MGNSTPLPLPVRARAWRAAQRVKVPMYVVITELGHRIQRERPPEGVVFVKVRPVKLKQSLGGD